jgi:Lipid A disaccharide synthetase
MLLKKEFPNIEFVCPTPRIVAPTFNTLKSKYNLEITHIDASSIAPQDFEIMKKSLFACSDMAIATSGTISLELARGGVPMIICYKTGLLTTVLYKMFVKVKSANLINIITGRQDIPEFLFERCTVSNIFKESKKILSDKFHSEKQLMAFREAIRSLGYGSLNPATRAAKSI